ncbi:MAG: GNAT family N-acetyltransferase [Lachnospiraceae bacterium]|nr:GNAT family N-acetyltransferase [Lachnospiraceae bacterium]
MSNDSKIKEMFLQFEAPDYSDEGIKSFQDFIKNEEIVKSLEFFGAYDNDELKGVIAVNENRRHICCFFVKALYHRQGIGKMLWEHILNNSSNMVFTVNSSPYAVPVYHKLGFVSMEGGKSMSWYFIVDTYIDEQKGRGEYDDYFVPII